MQKQKLSAWQQKKLQKKFNENEKTRIKCSYCGDYYSLNEINHYQTCINCEGKFTKVMTTFDRLIPNFHLDIKQKFNLTKALFSFNFFMAFYFGLVLALFQQEVVDTLNDNSKDRVMIQIPRGHGKSTLMELYVIWYLIRHPKSYVVVFSASADQAKERNVNIRKYIENTYPFNVMQHIRKWGEREFYLNNGSRCIFGGAGKQIAGARYINRRPDLIICDDIVPFDKATLTDDQVESWFLNIVSNLGGPTTKIIVVGTPYRQTDILAFLRDNPRYNGEKGKVVLYEGLMGKDIDEIDEPTTEALWPEYFPKSKLKEKLAEIGSLAFARNYLCRHVTSGAMLYPPEIMKPCKYINIPMIYQRSFDSQGKSMDFHTIVGACDLAISAEIAADYFVIIVYGITYEGKFQMLYIERFRGMTYKQQKSIVKQYNERYQFDLFIIESNQYQKVLAQEMAEETSIPILAYRTGTEKKDFEKGLPMMRTHMENKRYIFPFSQPTSDAQNAFFNEMSGVSLDQKGEIIFQTKHDDCVMANWLATIACNRMAFTPTLA